MTDRQGGPSPRPIVLVTDFGPQSMYVGQMELAIRSLAPAAPIVHLAHDVPAQNVPAAVLLLRTCRELLPSDAVLCVVVDPGVGTSRRIVAGMLPGGQRAVLPDNGLAAALEMRTAHEVRNRAFMAPRIATVFHGRDIFAPTAARLWLGAEPAEVGPRVSSADLVTLPVAVQSEARGGEILFADGFGNLVTNLRANPSDPGETLSVRDVVLPRVRTYGDAEPGSLVVVEGSFGNLEIAEVCGNAAAALDVGAGTAVTRMPGPPSS